MRSFIVLAALMSFLLPAMPKTAYHKSVTGTAITTAADVVPEEMTAIPAAATAAEDHHSRRQTKRADVPLYINAGGERYQLISHTVRFAFGSDGIRAPENAGRGDSPSEYLERLNRLTYIGSGELWGISRDRTLFRDSDGRVLVVFPCAAQPDNSEDMFFMACLYEPAGDIA